MVAFALEVVQSLLSSGDPGSGNLFLCRTELDNCALLQSTVSHQHSPWWLYTEIERFLEYKQKKDNTDL